MVNWPFLFLVLMPVYLLTGSDTHAQTNATTPLHGIVRDEKTLEAIPYAHVYIKDPVTNLFVGTITDLQGRFNLHLPLNHGSDSLNFTFVGYESLKVAINDLLKHEDDRTIRLRQSVTVLPVVVFRDLTAKDFFSRCMARFESNYLDISFLNSGFHWQSIKENNVFKALIQNNVVIREDNFKTKVDRNILKYPVSETRAVFYNDFDSLENILYFDLIRSTSGIMNKDNLNEWLFSYVTDAGLPEHYVRIIAKRKDNLGIVQLLIDDKQYAIEEVEFNYQWNAKAMHSLNDTLLYAFRSINGKILYNRNRTKYNLKYLQASVQYDVYKKINHRKQFSREVVHELVLNSSQPVQGSDMLTDTTVFPKPVIVNTKAYCDAANSLGLKSDFCPTNND